MMIVIRVDGVATVGDMSMESSVLVGMVVDIALAAIGLQKRVFPMDMAMITFLLLFLVVAGVVILDAVLEVVFVVAVVMVPVVATPEAATPETASIASVAVGVKVELLVALGVVMPRSS